MSGVPPELRRPKKKPYSDASEPFHHTAAKHGKRLKQEIATARGIVKTLYPGRPTAAQQRALLERRAVCCTSCSKSKMAADGCHAGWLVAALREKFGVACGGPEVVSGKIPEELKARVKWDPSAFAAARAIHEEAFVKKGAVFVCRTRGNRGMPSLLPELRLGTSQFGNPFSSGKEPVPAEVIRALFEAYVAGDFLPLSETRVREIAVRAVSS